MENDFSERIGQIDVTIVLQPEGGDSFTDTFTLLITMFLLILVLGMQIQISDMTSPRSDDALRMACGGFKLCDDSLSASGFGLPVSACRKGIEIT
ncbi:MAG: hypothetical protein JRJ47_06450 [Deltaproteobacteria bacterium]|nr:hypothetical protein [Deltaproteobacteria bacterium]